MRANDGTRTGGEVLVDQLLIHGVRYVFCVPGESYLAALDAMYDANSIRVITCQRFMPSAFAAGRRKCWLISRSSRLSPYLVITLNANRSGSPVQRLRSSSTIAPMGMSRVRLAFLVTSRSPR